ncbi:MAG: methyltransferase [Candidatus Binatia bacterium]
MNLWVFLAAALLLSFERICYLWIWHAPGRFRDLCARLGIARCGRPVDVLQRLFFGFKLLQGAVFIAWCYILGNGSLVPPSDNPAAIGAGLALIILGQTLNVSVFYRLGKVGVFYGDRFGYKIAWCREFPFSLCKHPQYAGTLISIWGFFLVMRFPQDDWYLLPVLETVYYTLGAYLER